MPSIKNVHNVNPEYHRVEVPRSPVEERGKEYKHSIVKSKDVPLASIMEHIEGSDWYVDYAAQLKYSDEAVNHYDVNAAPADQQYHLIRNFNLKLQNQDIDTEDRTNVIGISGTAVIYAGVIPNVGDVMFADIGAGMGGRLAVERVTKKSYMLTAVYEIEWKFMDYLSMQSEQDHFMTYVVKESMFNKELIKFGGDPVVTDAEFSAMIDANDVMAEMIDDFLKEFGSLELGSIVIPGNKYDGPIYDPFVVEAFKTVVPTEAHPSVENLRSLNVNELKGAYGMSIWPVLIEPHVNKIRNNWYRAGLVPYNAFHINPTMHSFRFSGYKHCVSPVEDLCNVDYYNGWAQQSKVGNFVSGYSGRYIITNSFGTTIGEQLLKELRKQKDVCCHHLVHYHAAHPSNGDFGSRDYIGLVQKWIRATGHWHVCGTCGGCDSCCDHHDHCDGHNHHHDPCEEDKHSYVFPYSFWCGKNIDSPYLNMVRRHLNGDKIPLEEIMVHANNRMMLDPKDRLYQMMVLIIIMTSSMRSA